MTQFTHLHVHSQYSVLDGMAPISKLIEKSVNSGMYALALTDHGNMYGIKEFAQESDKYNKGINEKIKELEGKIAELKKQLETLAADAEERNKVETEIATLEAEVADLRTKFFKPIFGCEAYVARITSSNPTGDRTVTTNKENSSGYHLILLAKNKTGYYNLCRIISKGWTEGFYSRPRIDRALLSEYHEGLICASACLGGELHKLIEANRIEEAKAAARWYKETFGDDYYIELQRHKTNKPRANQDTFLKQDAQNKILIEIARELEIKLIATNDVHFASEDDAEAHDLLICLGMGNLYSDTRRLSYTKQEWLKSPEEMAEIFADYPESLENTMEIADKVENYKLDHAPMMPIFDIPKEFGTEEEYRQKLSHEDLLAEFEATEKEKGRIEKLGGFDKVYRIKLEADYLKKLTMDGAHIRYGKEIDPEIMERIEFELKVMKDMGFPGYFLIVQDFIRAARDMGVSVGPGRGSAAGSVVAYCLKITDVDPLKYDLLFERFLNPDRISLPDIDIDFDNEGRGKVLDWVTEKYGHDRVAHIITYGTMATKSSIKDVARVLEYPLDATNYITKLIPDKFPEEKKGEKPPKMNVKNCIKYVPEIKKLYHEDELLRQVMDFSARVEGTVRQVGVHACGVIIGADDLANHAPLATVEEDKKTRTRICVTQYEGNKVESVGLIKMDFLGLTTLSIIKECIRNIKKSKKIEIDIDTIPIDDKKTYELYSRGNTVAVFQFESPGMQKYLKELHPTRFEDLIAMNALYRPGPMDNIPSFIARKQGREPIVYDIPIMEKYLSDTYGITVYQEQVMLLSRLLAGFTRGESDELRKAMGKKIIAVLDRLKPKFINGGKAQGHDEKVLEKIWSEWEKFASYAFNKSHATCYSWVSYQTAYLKAHYPAEFMAANMTSNLDKIDEIVKLIEDCRAMKIQVFGPDLNESDVSFTVNAKGQIRFGLAGLVGVGDSAALSIVEEREKNGPFKDIFDFFARLDTRNCNRRVIEALAKAGAFDCFPEYHRAQYFFVDETNKSTIEKLLSYSVRTQTPTSQFSIFDEMPEESSVPKPEIKACEPWNHLDILKNEFEVAKIFISGHPLNPYKTAIEEFSNIYFNEIGTKDLIQYVAKPAMFGAIVKSANILLTKKGTEYGKIVLEDINGHNFDMALFGSDYLNFYNKFKVDAPIFVKCIAKKRFNSDKDAPDVYELKPHEVFHLDDIYRMMCKEVTLCINIMDLNNELAHSILEAVKKSKGKTPLKIRISERNATFHSDFRNNAFLIDVEKFIKNLNIESLNLQHEHHLKLK